MHRLSITGGIFAILAGIFTFLGSYYQAKEVIGFQDNVQTYVDEQKESNIPNLVGLKILGKDSNYKLLVKNIGNQPAKKVKLIFKDNSVPNAFTANLIPGTDEIPHGVEYEFPLNIFSGIEMLIKLPNTDEKYKKELEEYLNKFNLGEKVLIPRFYLEYYFNDKKFTSEDYYLIFDKNNGLTYFGKETN